MSDYEEFFPLSPMQLGVLFHSLYAPDAGLYCFQRLLTLQGRIDIGTIRRAWSSATRRHAILRTCFLWENVREPVQVVYREAPVPIVEHDLQFSPSDQREQHLKMLQQTELALGFDLRRPPLLRVHVIWGSDDLCHILYTFHYLLLDGWSEAILLSELFTVLQGASDGVHPEAPSYSNYIRWLRRQNLVAAEKFWNEALRDIAEPTLFSCGNDKTSDMKEGVAREYRDQELWLPAHLSSEVEETARRHRLTQNTLAVGAWALLLAHYNDADDITFGTIVSGRSADVEGIDRMLGVFTNCLPARFRIPGEIGVLSWLGEVQQKQARARQFEHAPLVQIQKWSGIDSRTSLFDTILNFDRFPVSSISLPSAADLRLIEITGTERSNYPLAMTVTPGEKWRLRVTFDANRFSEPAIQRLLRHFRQLLESFVINSDKSPSDQAILPPEEVAQLEQWSRL